MKPGQVVAYHRNGIHRHGVVLETSVKEDRWRYFTIQWVGDGLSLSPEVHRYDQVVLIDPERDMESLHKASALSRVLNSYEKQ